MAGMGPDGIGAVILGVAAMAGAAYTAGTTGLIRAITRAFIVAISAMIGTMQVASFGKSGGKIDAKTIATSDESFGRMGRR